MNDPTANIWRCTIQADNGAFCDERSMEDVPFPICEKHAFKLISHVQGEPVVPVEPKFSPLVPYERDGRRQAMMTLQRGEPMVYACKVEGGIIKIGCTRDIYLRMSQLHGELLGFMFGDYDDEKAIHETLQADLHHGREWFNPTPAVMAVVNDMREQFSLEPIAA